MPTKKSTSKKSSPAAECNSSKMLPHIAASVLRYPGGNPPSAKELLWAILEAMDWRTDKVVSIAMTNGVVERALADRGHKVEARCKFIGALEFWTALLDDANATANAIKYYHAAKHEGLSMFEREQKRLADFADMRQASASSCHDFGAAGRFYFLNMCSHIGNTISGTYAGMHNLTYTSIEYLRKVKCPNLKVFGIHPDFDRGYREILDVDNDAFFFAELPGIDDQLDQVFPHERFATHITKKKNWLICYPESEAVRDLYCQHHITNIGGNYIVIRPCSNKNTSNYHGASRFN